MVGYILIGVSQFLNGDTMDKYGTRDIVLGFVLMMISNFLGATQTNIEEIILKKYCISPQRMIGLEGFFGNVWVLVL